MQELITLLNAQNCAPQEVDGRIIAWMPGRGFRFYLEIQCHLSWARFSLMERGSCVAAVEVGKSLYHTAIPALVRFSEEIEDRQAIASE